MHRVESVAHVGGDERPIFGMLAATSGRLLGDGASARQDRRRGAAGKPATRRAHQRATSVFTVTTVVRARSTLRRREAALTTGSHYGLSLRALTKGSH